MTLGASRQYVSLERRATKIAMVYNEIPGLLQTAEFAYTALSLSPVIVVADMPTSPSACCQDPRRAGPCPPSSARIR
jgi:hypothetical protein